VITGQQLAAACWHQRGLRERARHERACVPRSAGWQRVAGGVLSRTEAAASSSSSSDDGNDPMSLAHANGGRTAPCACTDGRWHAASPSILGVSSLGRARAGGGHSCCCCGRASAAPALRCVQSPSAAAVGVSHLPDLMLRGACVRVCVAVVLPGLACSVQLPCAAVITCLSELPRRTQQSLVLV
jgi:hypothetical protein